MKPNKAFCVEIVKVIVTTVEAASYEDACAQIESIEEDGEFGESWSRAENQYTLLDESDL